MEVLLRENYKWTPVRFNVESGTICLESGASIAPTAIVSVRDDDRKNYVVCKHCAEIILNTPEALREHYNKCEDSKACFTCRYRCDSVQSMVSKNYEINADGTYNRVITESVNIRCNRGTMRGPDINSADARRNCKYAECRAMGVEPINDIFISHPGAFDTIITVDALDPKRWHLEGMDRGFYMYKAKTRYRLYAAVNKMGIVDHFVYRYNSYTYRAVYSAKYSNTFWMDSGMYREGKPDYSVTAERSREITAEIAKLYKE